MSDPVSIFETVFAEKIGSKYAIAVNSCTSALHAALVACDVKGGEVIMPALCPAMDAFAIIHAGATPVFADVDPLTHLVTHGTLAQAISPKTKAIIVVALHGLPSDIDPILELARLHKIMVIEDCAQCLFGEYKDGYAGTKADIGCFSFERKKHLTTGSEGGMIVTNYVDLATRARKFAGIGYKHMTAEAGRTSLDASVYQNPSYERFDTIGLNYRMSHAQAEIGLEKLKTIDSVIEQRREIGYLWQFAFGESCQPHTYDAHNTFYTAAFPYMGDWVKLYDQFISSGGDGFYAMPQCSYKEPALAKIALPWINCPVAEELQRTIVAFKSHYKTIAHAKRQTDIFSSVFK